MELSKIQSTTFIEPVLFKTAKVKRCGNSYHITITKEEMEEFLEKDQTYGVMLFNYIKEGEKNENLQTK